MSSPGADPAHPITSAGTFADALRQARDLGPGVDVDLTGVGSIPVASPFTVGRASAAKALAGGFAGRTAGPAPVSKSTVDALSEWSRRRDAERGAMSDFAELMKRQAVLQEAIEETRANMAKGAMPLAAKTPEEYAMARARRKMAKHLAKTNDPTAAIHAGFARYRQHAGKKSFTAFRAAMIDKPT